MSDRFPSILAVCMTVLLLAAFGLLWQHCENQYARREQCIKDGKSAEDCRLLYPSAGDSR